MTITYELDLDKFEAWSGGEDTLSRIRDEGKEDEFYALLEDVYPDGLGETELNDLLRFEADWIYRSLGMKTDEEPEPEEDEDDEIGKEKARLVVSKAAKEGESYSDFCDSFPSCKNCPLRRWAFEYHDCGDVFEELTADITEEE